MGLKPLLRLCRETVVRLGKTESSLVRVIVRKTFYLNSQWRKAGG